MGTAHELRSDSGPFSIVPEWVIDSDASDRAVRLYAVLARHADSDSGEAWPAKATLAARLHCSSSSVDRALDELITLGAVDRQERWRTDGGQTSNLYTIRRTRGPAVVPPHPTRGEGPRPTGEAQNKSHDEREPPLPPASDVQTVPPGAPDPRRVPPQGRKYSDAAQDIADVFWRSLTPRPMIPFPRLRVMVQRALDAGWPESAVSRALAAVGRTVVEWKLEQELERGEPGEDRGAAEPRNPAAKDARRW